MHEGSTGSLAKAEKHGSLRVVHAETLEDDFLLMSSTEANFLYTIADDFPSVGSEVGYPEPPSKDCAIRDVYGVWEIRNRILY